MFHSKNSTSPETTATGAERTVAPGASGTRLRRSRVAVMGTCAVVLALVGGMFAVVAETPGVAGASTTPVAATPAKAASPSILSQRICLG